MQQACEKTLIERVKNGDRLAFSELLSNNYSFIYRVAYKWTGDQSDAEDVTQNVCIKLAKTISSFKGQASFSSWLYRITLNTVRDLQRKQKSYKNMGQQLQFVTQDHVMPDHLSETKADTLWKNVQTLPEKQRDAVLLVYSEGMSHKEAAEIMGCKESTVSWHIHKAREILKETMMREEID